jgi:hypothetical protein
MPNDLLTAGKIAESLKVPGPAVKKAIAALKMAPAAKKGVCAYYSADQVAKIKKAISA